MEQVFIERLVKRLIMEKDCLLAVNEEGRIAIGNKNVLIKQDGQYVTYIQILNVSGLPTRDIDRLSSSKNERLLRIQEENKTFAYNILIFPEGIQEETLRLLEERQTQSVADHKALKCFVVDLKNNQVYRLFSRPSSDKGLLKVLRESLNETSSKKYDELAIEEAVINKKKDYQISYEVKKPVVTYSLIAINILVYLAVSLYEKKSGISYGELIIRYGAKVNSLILEGDYWRFITPIFLHGSLMHLFVNCYSLFMIGGLVERMYGRGKFITIYLLAGILGNLCSFVFVPGPSVGASGAIFGLMGVLLYFGLERPLQFKTYFGRDIITTILFNLAYGFASTGIDNFAHLGGLVGGFLGIGLVAKVKEKRWYFNKLLYGGVLSLLFMGGGIYGFTNSESTVIRKLNTLEILENDKEWAQVEKVAKEILKEGSHYETNQITALWSLIRAQGIQGKYEEAIPYCEALIEISPENGHYLLGVIYYNQGKMELAKEELGKAQGLGSNTEQIQEILNEIQ